MAKKRNLTFFTLQLVPPDCVLGIAYSVSTDNYGYFSSELPLHERLRGGLRQLSTGVNRPAPSEALTQTLYIRAAYSVSARSKNLEESNALAQRENVFASVNTARVRQSERVAYACRAFTECLRYNANAKRLRALTRVRACVHAYTRSQRHYGIQFEGGRSHKKLAGRSHRITNLLMSKGKKNHASQVLLNSLDVCKSQISLKGVYVNVIKAEQKKERLLSNQICAQTVRNVEPILEIRKVRVRGNTYQVPSLSYPLRRERVAVRWIVASARDRKGVDGGVEKSRPIKGKSVFSHYMGKELLDSLKKQGNSIRRRDQTYQIAAQNRAYIRYRWW